MGVSRREGLPQPKSGGAPQPHDEDEGLKQPKEGVIIAERERAGGGFGEAGE